MLGTFVCPESGMTANAWDFVRPDSGVTANAWDFLTHVEMLMLYEHARKVGTTVEKT